jgi:lipoprotein-releasing system permease protein
VSADPGAHPTPSAGSDSAVAWTLALRYLRTRRRQFAAFITWISMAGLMLGVLVLTVVLSVMNGFDAELKDRILGSVPHMLLPGRSVADPEVRDAMAIEGVTSGYDFFLGAGMLTRNGAVNPVTIYGIDPTDPAAGQVVSGHMVHGTVSALVGTEREILLGAPLASRLSLLPGDTVALVVSEPGPTGIRPRIRPCRLVGTFEIGADLDYGLVVMDRADFSAAERSALGRDGVRLTLENPLLAADLQRRLSSRGLSVESWTATYGELFDAVRLEKLMMFLILLMVVAVAAFNIVSGQMMVVADKRSDIAILRTMGARDATILQAFLFQGVVISGIGIGVGLVAGVIIAHWISEVVAWLKDWFGFGLLDGTYFAEVPVRVVAADLWLIALLSALLCAISAWIPARRAAALNPIEGLHL